jgi:hypothetical protein
MRTICLALAALVLPFHAHALDNEALATAISLCWNPPQGGQEPVTLDAKIDVNGNGVFRVAGHDPSNLDLVAESVLRAAARC